MREAGNSMSPSYSEASETEQPTRVFRTPMDRPIRALAARFGGSKPKEMERFLRFAVVGISGAVIDFGILFFLQAFVLHPVDISGNPLVLNVALATGISFFTAVVSNFTWTRLWVYPESRARSLRRQLTQFTIISVAGGVMRTIWIATTFLWWGAIFMPILLPVFQIFRPEYVPSHTAEAKLGTIIAQLIGMVVVMLWNFFANRYWTYSDVK